METEDLNPQISTQPTPPVHFPKVAVISGVVLLTAFVIGAVFYFRNIKQITKKQVLVQVQDSPKQKPSFQQLLENTTQSTTLIYGERHKDPQFNTDNIVIYSVNSDTKIQRELFNIPINSSASIYDFRFCAATNKIYIRYPEAGVKLNVADNLFVKEFDLAGNIRDLDFTGMTSREPLESYDRGFVLSKDCKKILWSTRYYDQINHQKQISEIAFANIDGSEKKILRSVQQADNGNSEDDNGNLVKLPYAWSDTNPNIVYFTNPGNKRDSLFRLELDKNSISQINAVPTDEIIMDISNNDTLIGHQAYGVPESFITNLANNSTVPINIGSKSIIMQGKFSPDSSKLAYIALDNNSIDQFDCPLNLYIFDPFTKIDKLVTRTANICDRTVDSYHFYLLTESNIFSWLTNNTIIYVKDGKNLIMANVGDGKESKLASVSGELVFLGISDK